MSHEIRTKRLILRQWRDSDRDLFASMNQDPLVMQYFPRFYSRVESDAFVSSAVQQIESSKWGNWAVEVIDQRCFIGFTGFSEPACWHPCAGEVEIGWRLRAQFWGRGYATEAAQGALRFAFGARYFDRIVSFTAACNLPSIAVMKKIAMRPDPIGFEHPRIEVGSRLRTHVVYRLAHSEWQQAQPD